MAFYFRNGWLFSPEYAQSLTISGGRIVVTMLAHGPGDGLCCPSTEISRAFTYRPTGRHPLHGRRLVPAPQLVIESPLPGETVATGVEVRGKTSTLPSGDGLAYLVYDARGGVIGMGRIAVAADSGSPRSPSTMIQPRSITAPPSL